MKRLLSGCEPEERWTSETFQWKKELRRPGAECLLKYSSRTTWSWSNPFSTILSTIVCCAMTLDDLNAHLSVKLDGAKPRYTKHPTPSSSPQSPWRSPVRPHTMPLSWTEILKDPGGARDRLAGADNGTFQGVAKGEASPAKLMIVAWDNGYVRMPQPRSTHVRPPLSFLFRPCAYR